MRLKDWSVTTDIDIRFAAPEFIHYHLQGNVYGHPNFHDGTFVTTSRIVEVNDKSDHAEVITKSGSVYELYREDIRKDAEDKYPNYYERLKLKAFGGA